MSKTNETNGKRDGTPECSDYELEAFLAEIEGDTAKEQLASKIEKLRAERDRLNGEADRLDAQISGPGKRDGPFRVITGADWDWEPTEEEKPLVDERDRLQEEAKRLHDEANRLEEEEASRLEADEAHHLATNPEAALDYLKTCLSRALPYNLRRLLPLFDAPTELEPEELELLRTEAAHGYEDALYSSRSLLTAPMASDVALETYLSAAPAAAGKNEVRRLLGDLLARELTMLWIRHDLKIEQWEELDPEQAELAQRVYAPTVAPLSDRYGLTGLSALCNVLLGPASPEDKSEWQRICAAEAEREAASGPPAKVLRRTLAEVEARRILWLLPGRLARSEITMVNGWPGAGKTSAIVDIVARLSRGEGLPGDRKVERQRILYLATEDRAETLRLRFEAARANLDMIDVPDESTIDHLRLPSGETEWKRYLRDHGIGVVVLDPLMGLMDADLNAIREQDMRKYMRSLSQAIADTRTAVFAIRHPNKASASGNMLAIASSSNSLALTAAARLELLIASVPGSEDGLRAMATVKNNLSAFAATLGFQIPKGGVMVAMKDGGPPENVAAVEWGEELDLDANDLMRRKEPRAAEASAAAEVFLREFLADRPRLKSEVVAAGKERGITERTLQRTIARIGHSDGKKHKPGATWSLVETAESKVEAPPDLSDLSEEPVSATPGAGPSVEQAEVEAEVFLREFLTGCDRLESEVVAAGKERGITERTLQRTIERIGWSMRSGKWGAMWCLKSADDEFNGMEGPADLSDLGEEPVKAPPAAAPSVKQAEYFEESGPSPPLPAGESSQGQDTADGRLGEAAGEDTTDA